MSSPPKGARFSADKRPPSKKVSVQARSQSLGLATKFKVYLLTHLQVILLSLGRIARKPIASIMTTGVIAISIALPTGLYISLDNLRMVSGNWDRAAQLSLFLKQDISDARARHLADEIRARTDVEAVELILRDQALEEFRRTSGFGDALNTLDKNPLPSVISVRPKAGLGSAAIRLQAETLGNLEDVEMSQLDMEWLQRLFAMMDIVQRIILIITVLLVLGVLLAVGNTIRLDIENRREEIVVSKLIGATNGFIRRPFLYSGIWFGLLGGSVAWITVSVGMGLLEPSVQHLTHLYQSGYQLQGLGFSGGMTLLAVSALLGWIGSWLAVGRHLHSIEPT